MAEALACPGCGEAVEIPTESAGQLVRCPYCNTDFFGSVEQSHLAVVDDTPAVIEHDRDGAFDHLRIEHYTALRMGAIRARSWWVITLCMSMLILLDLAGQVMIDVLEFHRWDYGSSVRLLAIVAAGAAARHAWRRAAQFKKEIDHSAIPQPTTPPDFSTLGDGSDRWKHLENVR